MVGIKCRHYPIETCSTLQFKLEGEDPEPGLLKFWKSFPGIQKGYVWVFPKVKSGTINVGLGTLTPSLNEPSMHDVLQDFKSKFYPGNKILDVSGGAVPVGGFISDYTADRFLLLGDAAHHTNPLTGGGIMSAMQGATIAAEWIDRAFKSGNFSHAFFHGYQNDCWEKFGNYNRKKKRMRDFIFSLSRKDEKKMFQIIKNLAEHDFSIGSRIKTFPGILLVLVKNIFSIISILKKPL